MPGHRNGANRIEPPDQLSKGRIHVKIGTSGEGREFDNDTMLQAFCDSVEERLRQLLPDLSVYLSAKSVGSRGKSLRFDLDAPNRLVTVS
jgi:alkanesulfonate monooxygenase SsuD/methylene tetrahydromethanopterin reductase-like flavin-dependent oxidoreductase (luciferase family)